ncbi:uncharacterized protein LOC123203743 [Mangifera indica]|uniref:uncharacterized protein LOC123203743 n=1 Tax=Mangifera indica TaxID=29780 RepID=UPI001CF96C35|nr:uncharacterized protein LOC123203743 [Mangifera indica]
MGCCFGKFSLRKSKISTEESTHVEDKLVISQASEIPTPIPLSNKISPSPPSPPSCASSVSSFTCSTGNTTESCSAISTASSVLSSKDRSFSNEFLWACVKENPHVVRINSIKEAALSLATSKVEAQMFGSPAKSFVAPTLINHSIPQRIKCSTPQKIVRLSEHKPSTLVLRHQPRSPATLTRQKSFCMDRQNSSYSLPSRPLRSPSPSRRFSTGDSNRGLLTNTHIESCSKRIAGAKLNGINSVSSSLKRENFRPASPSNNNSMGLRVCTRNRETCTYRIGSKIDEVAAKEAVAEQGSECFPTEDIDNPLISLDCFIFL